MAEGEDRDITITSFRDRSVLTDNEGFTIQFVGPVLSFRSRLFEASSGRLLLRSCTSRLAESALPRNCERTSRDVHSGP